mmetsp:Transcript_11758/g.31745  ORF Transcript_11758/g.31745 Transcript_11758/m.31745 type:complete len:209 (-) Transcript_11758:174-800(-)
MASEDRRPRHLASSVKAPPKKGGAGGHFTWGTADSVQDYEPVGEQGPDKVSVAHVASFDAPARSQPVEVPRNDSANFPRLSAARRGIAVGCTPTHPTPGEEVGETARVNFFVGALLALGGTIAYVRKGSVPSFVGGAISGAALVGSGALAKRQPRYAYSTGALVSALLAVGMLPRAVKTRKIMPAGMVAFFGILACIFNVTKLQRLKS